MTAGVVETELKLRVSEKAIELTPVKATTPALDSRMSVSDAFACIASTTLRQLQANEEGVLTAQDPEFLHQMRVALRRLRSALSAFSPVLPQASREPIVKELKWLGGALGAARDWDVLLSETLPQIRQACADHAALDTVIEGCRRLQLAAHRDVHRTMRSRRYQRAMLATGSWLASQSWREGADDEALAALDAPVREYAQIELERRYERVRKRGRKLDDHNPEELHRLRIAVKKLRYSVDFFASLFDAEALRTVKPRLSRLQDVLGALNDASTLRRLLADVLVAAPTPEVAEARGLVLGWGAGRADALRRDLRRSWKAFRRSGTFW